MAPLPADIVSSVDSLLDAASDAERVEAATAMLASIGVAISGDEAATAEGPAAMVLAPEEVEVMAVEAADRTLHRATLAEFAEAFGGMALLPPNEALADGLPDDWLDAADPGAEATDQPIELDLGPLPAHMAAVVNGWVTSAIESHASTDADLVELTNAPLLLAELARRRSAPVDLAQTFTADDLRLSWLEITILTAGMRGMLTGAEANGIAAAPTGASIVLAVAVQPTGGTRAPDAQSTPCGTLKQLLDSRVPLATTVINGYVGDAIKGFIQNFVNALFGESSAFAQNVSRSFKILSIMFRVQALIMLYSESTATVEMDPTQFHKPDGDPMTVAATVEAGIPDGAWAAAQQARQLSPFATAVRTCARFIGLPVWQDLVDAGEAISAWSVGWTINKGSEHVRFNAREEFWGPGAVPGRQEKPLSRVNDHMGNDILGYEVLAERRENHPGTEMQDPVQLCAHVYPKAPPSGFGTILSAGSAGASLAGGSYLGLVGVIASLLTGWVSTVVPIKACGDATVSYHVPQAGEWTGTLTANTEVHESSSGTVNEHLGPPWGTTVHTHTSQMSLDVTDRFFLGGTEDPPGMGYVALEGRQYTQGAVTDSIVSSSVNRWSPSGCGYDLQETAQSGGGWYFDLDAGATLTLYADGKYTISWYGSEPEEEIFVPGQSDRQVTLREGGCIDTGTGTDERPYWPSPLTGSAANSMVEGRVDPLNPGTALRGSHTFTNYDLSTTTVTWNLRHEGPIRLPSY